ncbi:MAG: glycosyltransferase family 2 protein, partial [Proteobacteria bacterium]|nr:glycosyltransferase family 2 protein [Pseudomonadota bacterium]
MKNTQPDRVLVIIPAYNEEPHIAGVARGARSAVPGAGVLVVDDGSTDRTGALAAEAGARVMTLPFNLGYGAALQAGFHYALSRGYTHAVLMDGDGQHDPASIPGLLAPVLAGAADVAVGSRFLENGE